MTSEMNVLVDAGFKELTDVIGDRNFSPNELMELVAIGTKITKKMSQVDNLQKKDILISMIEKYIANHDYSEAEKDAAAVILASLDVSINVLFDFKKGVFNADSSRSVIQIILLITKYLTQCAASIQRTRKPSK